MKRKENRKVPASVWTGIFWGVESGFFSQQLLMVLSSDEKVTDE